jgi:hypothetical protein
MAVVTRHGHVYFYADNPLKSDVQLNNAEKLSAGL